MFRSPALDDEEEQMGAHELDLDLDPDQRAGLVKSVKGAVAGISHEDAEDAVQDAWLVVAEKADRLEPGPIGGYLRGTARNKAMKIRDKARKTTSLDALVEVAGDASRALIDSRVASLDAQADLARLSEDPIAARAIAAAEGGAAPYVAPRGVHHPCARYTDEQVKRVRELHGQGRTYKEIEELTGVPAGYCPALVKDRVDRLLQARDGPGSSQWRQSDVSSAGSAAFRECVTQRPT